jgi:hypothetical protein
MNEDEMAEIFLTHGEIRNAYKILVGETEEKSHFGDLYEDRMIILKRILNE